MSGDMERSDNSLTTAKNASRKVKTSQIRPSMQNSPNMLETKMAKHPGQCKHVSNDADNAYVPHNMPIEALGTGN